MLKPPFASIILSLLIKVVKKCWLDQIIMEQTSSLLQTMARDSFTLINDCMNLNPTKGVLHLRPLKSRLRGN